MAAGRHLGKFQMAISGTGRPIDFMFGSTVKVQEKIMREE